MLMKTILLIVDNETSWEYETFSPETKHHFACEVNLLLKKIARDERCAKLNQLIEDINNDRDYTGINTELLMKLLPID